MQRKSVKTARRWPYPLLLTLLMGMIFWGLAATATGAPTLPGAIGRAQASKAAKAKKQSASPDAQSDTQVYEAQIAANQRQIKTYEKLLKQSAFIVQFNPQGALKTASPQEIETTIQQSIRTLAAQGAIRTQQQAIDYHARTLASVRQLDSNNRARIRNQIQRLKNTNATLRQRLGIDEPQGAKAAAKTKPHKAAPGKTASPRVAGYKLTPNAALRAHSLSHLDNVSPRACGQACDEQAWCVSFDYDKAKRACDLSNKRAGGFNRLRKNMPGSAFDHYSK